MNEILSKFNGVIVTGKDSSIRLDKNTDIGYFLPQNSKPIKMKIAGATTLIPKDPMNRGPKDQSVLQDDESTVTYTCEKPFCAAEFPTYQQLEQHNAAEVCYEQCRNQPIGDYLRVRYFMYFGSMNANKTGT